jgi:HAMP domain-containing protein
MSLLVRINLALGAAFLVVAIALGYACSRLLEANAREELLRVAGLMLDSAVATRTYTSEEVVPLLGDAMKSSFRPQSVPFYAATQNFLKLHERHPEYAYKEAALNPTNPRDRAMDWEADIIHEFRNAPRMTELVGERDTPMGRSLYVARPIRVDSECLSCHGSPNAAPATLLARYGANNGFGWDPHEVVGAQVISVPLAAAEADAARTGRGIMTAVAIALAGLLAFANGIAGWFTVRPARRLIRVADALSRGESPAEEFPTRGSAEITALARAFNRMRISLEKSMKLLEH